MISRRPTARHNRGRIASGAGVLSVLDIFGAASIVEFMCADCGVDIETDNWTGSVNGHVFVPANDPLWNPSGLNGHAIWSWARGSAQRHVCAEIDLPAPPFTILGVVRSDDWNLNATLVGNSAGLNSGGRILQGALTPELQMNNGSSQNASGALAVGEWGVVIAEFTNSTADTLTVAGASVTGANSGATNPGAGVQLAAAAAGSHWSGSVAEWLFLLGTHAASKHAAYRRRVSAIYGSSVRV